MTPAKWDEYPNFSEAEFECSHCSICRMDHKFMNELAEMRQFLDFPIQITSGYRCETHNNAIGSKKTSAHVAGMGADIWVAAHRWKDVDEYVATRFSGVGRRLHGADRRKWFMHLDVMPRRAVWTYA